MNEVNLTAETQRRRENTGLVSSLLSQPLRLGVSAVNIFLCASLLISFAACAAEENRGSLYQNDFSKGEVGKLPEEMLLLDGGFAVQEVNGNKVLQLPGAPLDTFGVLFGPTEASDIQVKVRVHSTKKGRREPAFAVGLNGNAGYRLQVSAAKKLLDL